MLFSVFDVHFYITITNKNWKERIIDLTSGTPFLQFSHAEINLDSVRLSELIKCVVGRLASDFSVSIVLAGLLSFTQTKQIYVCQDLRIRQQDFHQASVVLFISVHLNGTVINF